MFRLRQPPPWAEPLLGLRAWRKLPALPAPQSGWAARNGEAEKRGPSGFPTAPGRRGKRGPSGRDGSHSPPRGGFPPENSCRVKAAGEQVDCEGVLFVSDKGRLPGS